MQSGCYLRGKPPALLLVVLGVLLAGCSGTATDTRSARYVVSAEEVSGGKTWVDNRDIAVRPRLEALATDGVHDPHNEALAALQEPEDAMGAFPIDRRGAIDWVKALDLGIINPRADIQGKTEKEVLDMDILFKDTGAMPWVKFPHSTHTKWLDCSNCHPDIFIAKKGANNIGMDGILAGEFCGRCHDKVAFPLWVCERCHSVPFPGSPKKWW